MNPVTIVLIVSDIALIGAAICACIKTSMPYRYRWNITVSVIIAIYIGINLPRLLDDTRMGIINVYAIIVFSVLGIIVALLLRRGLRLRRQCLATTDYRMQAIAKAHWNMGWGIFIVCLAILPGWRAISGERAFFSGVVLFAIFGSVLWIRGAKHKRRIKSFSTDSIVTMSSTTETVK
jgi:hypothetical protein